MHHGNNNHRRPNLNGSGAKDGVSPLLPTLVDSETTIQEKKIPKSILSLSCQRWMVRYLALRKTSQIMIGIIVISFLLLLPPTIYTMSSLSRSGYNKFVGRERNKRRGDKVYRNVEGNRRPIENLEHEANGKIYDKYGITSNESLKHFIHRKIFPSTIPRMVRLTDANHTYRFAFPPGAVSATDSSSLQSFPLPENGLQKLHERYVPLTMKNPKRMSAPDELYTDDCEPIDPSWQLAYHHTCNQIHEASGGWQEFYRVPSPGHEARGDDGEQIRLVNGGAFRHVWMIRDAHDGITKRAMKTLRALGRKGKNFDLRNHDRHRRDAISFEELSSSKLVVDLYASCSNTAIFDYADRGDVVSIFENEDDDKEKTPEEVEQFELHIMQIAYNVSMSVHDAHHFDAQGRATMAHTDIKADQFIYQDGYYKLSDFNRVRFQLWDTKKNDQCGFYVGKNGGEYRSPEEYMYKKETEKVDVFSLGNVLYFLLTQEEVWEDFGHSEVYSLVKAGQRAKIPDKIYKSEGLFERYMIRAIESAWVHVPEWRPGALQVAEIIKQGIELKKMSMTESNPKR
jgi:hypothetical protein